MSDQTNNQIEIERMYRMEIGATKVISHVDDKLIQARRVPGGWVYEYSDSDTDEVTAVTFVPLPIPRPDDDRQ